MPKNDQSSLYKGFGFIFGFKLFFGRGELADQRLKQGVNNMGRGIPLFTLLKLQSGGAY